MPLGIDHLATVGFILGEGAVDGEWVPDAPIGTAFKMTVHGEKRLHGYVVTAKHVLKDQSAPTVRFRTHEGEIEHYSMNGWWESLEHDIAVSYIDKPAHQSRYAISMEAQSMDALDFMPQLGADVYYVGLLNPVPSMGLEGIPMVRSGTLGAMYQTIQPKDEPPFIAHLLDCRSYAGFSGSPCVTQIPFPGPPLDDRPVDRFFKDSSEPKVSEIGLMRYATVLIGLFKSHYRDPRVDFASNMGLGVVVPVEYISRMLMNGDLVKHRKEVEDSDPETPDYEMVDTAVHQDEELAERRADFMHDLEKVSEKVTKRRRDPEA